MRSVMGLVLAGALSLAGCSEEATTEEPGEIETGGELSGDVLGGSISDDMLPLEAVTWQSPPAERTNEEGAASGDAAPSE